MRMKLQYVILFTCINRNIHLNITSRIFLIGLSALYECILSYIRFIFFGSE